MKKLLFYGVAVVTLLVNWAANGDMRFSFFAVMGVFTLVIMLVPDETALDKRLRQPFIGLVLSLAIGCFVATIYANIW